MSSQMALNALADAALGQVEFIRQCRAGHADLKCERPVTKQERNHEQYLRRKREHPDYYTKQARRDRAMTRLNTDDGHKKRPRRSPTSRGNGACA